MCENKLTKIMQEKTNDHEIDVLDERTMRLACGNK